MAARLRRSARGLHADGSGLAEKLRSDAAAAADALAAPSPGLRAASRSAPKQIATIALHAQITRSAQREEALQAAASSLGLRLNLTAGGLKKATSEARAILHFGLGSGAFAPAAGESSDQLLRRIDQAVRAVNLRQVSRDRAQTLAGVRGGPRPSASRWSLRFGSCWTGHRRPCRRRGRAQRHPRAHSGAPGA